MEASVVVLIFLFIGLMFAAVTQGVSNHRKAAEKVTEKVTEKLSKAKSELADTEDFEDTEKLWTVNKDGITSSISRYRD